MRLALILGLLLNVALPVTAQRIPSNLPLSFEENQGQFDQKVKFRTRGEGYDVFLTGSEVVLSLQRGAEKFALLQLRIPGGNPDAGIEGRDELPGKSNYFVGQDSSRWRSNVPTYGKVAYRRVLPGIDLVYYGNQRQLEYDFVVASGADPNAIRLAIDGASKLWVDAAGDLIARAAGEEVRWRKPVLYQSTATGRREIAGSYVIHANHEVGFAVGAYDHTRELVIDPTVVFASYLGGTGADLALGLGLDPNGGVVVAGYTVSANYPATVKGTGPAPGSAFNGAIFVTKLTQDGKQVVFSTYLGTDTPQASDGTRSFLTPVAVDAQGNVYVAGTVLGNIPTTASALQPKHPGGSQNGFVFELNPTGSTLLYSTYFGAGNSGFDTVFVNSLALDSAGSVYIAGTDIAFGQTKLPVTAGAFQMTSAQSTVGFVAKFTPDLSKLAYCTLFGGTTLGPRNDTGTNLYGLAVDASGSAVITGGSTSPTLPMKNPLPGSSANSGNFVPYAAKFTPDGSALVFATYLSKTVNLANGTPGATNNFTAGQSVAVDSAGNIYLAGIGDNTIPANGVSGDYVAELSPTGAFIAASTLVGPTINGFNSFHVVSLAVGPDGSVVVAGACLGLTGVSSCTEQYTPQLKSVGYTAQVVQFGQITGVAIDAGGDLYLAGSSSASFTPVNAAQSTIGGSAVVRFAGAGAQTGFSNSPAIAAGGIVNGASFGKLPPAAGSIASLFGTNLAASTAVGSALPLPTSLGGVTVTVNGVPAPLFFVSAGQINFQIPWEIAGANSASIIVTRNGSISNSVSLTLASAGPGVFTVNSSGSGQGAIQIANTTIFAAPSGSIPGAGGQPVARGQFITVYCSGLGAVVSPPSSGAAATGQVTVTAPSMTIGGVSVTPSFAGLSPGFVGLYQINAQVPQSVTPGNAVTVAITMNGVAANLVTIAVQ